MKSLKIIFPKFPELFICENSKKNVSTFDFCPYGQNEGEKFSGGGGSEREGLFIFPLGSDGMDGWWLQLDLQSGIFNF